MRSCTIPSFIQPSDSFESPNSPVPANGAPLSVLILAGIPYSRIAASQIARTWLRSIRETIWQRIKYRLYASVMDNQITATNADNLMAPVKGPYAGGNRFEVLNSALWHISDHYGQLVEYVRMNGIVPPASR
jgi:hypothetical protein